MVREQPSRPVNKSMSLGLLKNVAENAEGFKLPEEMMLQAAMKSYEQHCKPAFTRKALKIAAPKYKLPEEMAQAAEKKIS